MESAERFHKQGVVTRVFVQSGGAVLVEYLVLLFAIVFLSSVTVGRHLIPPEHSILLASLMGLGWMGLLVTGILMLTHRQVCAHCGSVYYGEPGSDDACPACELAREPVAGVAGLKRDPNATVDHS